MHNQSDIYVFQIASRTFDGTGEGTLVARLRAQLLLRAAHEVWVAEDRDFTRRRASCHPGRRDAKTS